jgi:hypothetical protein
MSCSNSGPDVSNPPGAKEHVFVAQGGPDYACIAYQASHEGGELARDVARLGGLIATLPTPFCAVMPSSELANSAIAGLVRDCVEKMRASDKIQLVTCHTANGPVLIFGKNAWSRAGEFEVSPTASSLSDIVKNFIAEAIVQRKVAVVELFVPLNRS